LATSRSRAAIAAGARSSVTSSSVIWMSSSSAATSARKRLNLAGEKGIAADVEMPLHAERVDRRSGRNSRLG
jgi:hypothetical protein